MKKAVLWVIIIIVFAGIIWGTFFKTPDKYEKIGYALDTQIRIVIFDKGNHREVAEKAYNKILYLDRLLSNFNKDSETYKLNELKELTVSDELKSILKLGLDITEKTEGAYDLTVYPLTSIWDYKKEKVPAEDEIADALLKIGIENVVIDGNKVILKNGCSVDVSSIAKGYIADYIIDFLKKEGIKNAFIDAGGNIKTMGRSPKNKEGFTIGIKAPFKEAYGISGSLTVKDKSVVTSGIYERNFTKDGKLYHHIIDTATGYPSESDLLSATVICENSAMADACATAIVVMGSERGMEFIENNPQIEGILITKEKKVLTSSGVKDFKNNGEN